MIVINYLDTNWQCIVHAYKYLMKKKYLCFCSTHILNARVLSGVSPPSRYNRCRGSIGSNASTENTHITSNKHGFNKDVNTLFTRQTALFCRN